ncbi:GNAT family N-acetyltransferase [Fodinicola acaciae]|uniref:GNAT family N-acetyltransferase n=1 Tax=Fodinicola acaciae TaxID=2681555 RepID=UPI0013D2C6E0|nr:GNAT family N-acetyltransferase [Fodinicola acaciae]
MADIAFRRARADDAAEVATLHADSWRRHYRGAYADSFLDGDVVADRHAVWSERLAAPSASATVLAEREGELVGFVHVMFDKDERWGSLVDNLHVRHDQQRGGIGSALLGQAALAIRDQAAGDAMYLWVLRQNTSAQRFYRACGAAEVEMAKAPAPGGDPTRLNGSPDRLRMAWPDAYVLIDGPNRTGTPGE